MTQETTIIGFGYRARSGKDTAIAEIINQRGNKYDIRRYGFGDALKREVNEYAVLNGGIESLIAVGKVDGLPGTNLPVHQNATYVLPPVKMPDWVVYDPNADMTDPLCPLGKQRTLLQWWGTEYRRNAYNDYWVDALKRTIEREKPEFALICDVRFKNEVAFVWQSNGYLVKVIRPGLPKATHASETELDSFSDWDVVLHNDVSIETFQRESVMTFDYLRGRKAYDSSTKDCEQRA